MRKGVPARGTIKIMLRPGTLDELRHGRISRELGYVAVTMHHYPRGLRRELMDEYLSVLAPQAELLKDFLAHKKRLGNHNAAFVACRYEERFELAPEALPQLERLAKLSADRDVFLVCQCARNERCHREMLLILARAHFHVRTEPRVFSYPLFERRLLSEGHK